MDKTAYSLIRFFMQLRGFAPALSFGIDHIRWCADEKKAAENNGRYDAYRGGVVMPVVRDNEVPPTKEAFCPQRYDIKVSPDGSCFTFLAYGNFMKRCDVALQGAASHNTYVKKGMDVMLFNPLFILHDGRCLSTAAYMDAHAVIVSQDNPAHYPPAPAHLTPEVAFFYDCFVAREMARREGRLGTFGVQPSRGRPADQTSGQASGKKKAGPSQPGF